ncbi:MAG: hypothetical protein H7124_09715 [Phycisphaerales bacterium]|nr:hypothetical protein [Hyphomonadaceae bacterium]
MFFAQTLGPALTPTSAAALCDYVLNKTNGKRTLSATELHAAVEEFLTQRANASTPDSVIAFLKKLGRVTQEGAKYKLSA